MTKELSDRAKGRDPHFEHFCNRCGKTIGFDGFVYCNCCGREILSERETDTRREYQPELKPLPNTENDP
jgi:hypothetical protein